MNKFPTNRNKKYLKSESIADTKVIPIGGVEEIGINSTIYEFQNDVIVVDIGLGFSDFEYYGIDAIIPNLSYIKKYKKNLLGVFLTHGHLDHIGGISYLIEYLGFPNIYGTKFTIELLKIRLQEKGLDRHLVNKLKYIDEKSTVNLNSFEIKFFHVNHSIPQSVGLYIKTPTAKIVHTGDFKFDNSPVNEPPTDYSKIAEYGKEGIDLLLSDSTNSTKKGYPISETDVAKSLKDIVERAKGRIIISTFGGLVGRLYQLLDIAFNVGRKVCVTGYSMQTALGIASQIGYINIPKNLLISPEQVNKTPNSKIMILTTGAQGESNAGLSLMTTEKGYKGIKLKKGDTVVLSAKTIVGNDKAVQNLIDKIVEKGALVYQNEHVDFFTSGHGYQEDQKIMINLVKPKYFVPIHGYKYFLRAHAETAKDVGIPEDNIFILKKGSILYGNSVKGFKLSNNKVKCDPLIVSGNTIGDVKENVLKEREQLANYGIVIVNILVNSEKRLDRDPYVVSKGFIYVRENLELIQNIAAKAKKIFEESNGKEYSKIRDLINEEIRNYLLVTLNIEPIILTIINY